MTKYSELFPGYSGPGRMDDTWWARYALEEAALDRAQELSDEELSNMPAHDRLALLMRADAVNRYAEEHYEDGGWDVLVECWTPEEYLRFWEENPPNTDEEAIESVRGLVSVWDDRQSDARNSAF